MLAQELRILGLEAGAATRRIWRGKGWPSSITHAGRTAMGEKVIINIKSFTDGNPAPDRVIEGVTT